MKIIKQVGRAEAPKPFTTSELADLLRVKSRTIHVGYCRKGHYMGLVPQKLPNRLLRWSAADVEKLLATSR